MFNRRIGLAALTAAALLLLLFAVSQDSFSQSPQRDDAEEPVQGINQQDVLNHVALAKQHVAIKQAAVKMAEARQKIAEAKLATLRALVIEAQALESVEKIQFTRTDQLYQQKVKGQSIVAKPEVDLGRSQWNAAEARKTAAEGRLAEGEAQVQFEKACVELAQAEAGEADVRLKQLEADLEKNP
jgi:hypothetical protein